MNNNFFHIRMSSMSTVLGLRSSKFSMLLEKPGFIPLGGFLDPGKEDTCNVRIISKKYSFDPHSFSEKYQNISMNHKASPFPVQSLGVNMFYTHIANQTNRNRIK